MAQISQQAGFLPLLSPSLIYIYHLNTMNPAAMFSLPKEEKFISV
jgi:hypothetical protein